MSSKYSNTQIHKFIRAFVESKDGELIDKSDEIFTIKYPKTLSAKEYTYQPVVAREKKIPLITTGSPAFQEILNECLENGLLCSVRLKSKADDESLLKDYFKDSPFACEDCDRVSIEKEEVSFCVKSPRCYHQINNAKIVSMKINKKERVRFFQFYFSAVFQNKLRPRNEETIMILIDEDGNIAGTGDFHEHDLLKNKAVEILDAQSSLETKVFDILKILVDEKLDSILKEKLAFFDLPLNKDIKTKLRSYDKRLREERREKLISKNHEFDEKRWQANHDALLKREEESYRTHIVVKFLNLLIINTDKVSFEINLDNNSTINSSFVLGVNAPSQVTCPGCGKTFFEGYATQDSYYLCRDCIRQSIETGRIYSTKQDLALDSTLNEYIEPDLGFVCSVCGKRSSRLLEFKCNHDNSSVCIHDYGLCNNCGRIFSEANLTLSKESNRKLCPKHIIVCEGCGSPIGVDEYRLCVATGRRLCSCTSFERCSFCRQEYSSTSLKENKCPACNSLSETVDPLLANVVLNHDSSQRKTTKWLIGRNKMNVVVVAKGVFSNTLYVIENDKVVFQRNISFLDKLRGH
ncbi:MAG: hypothetical protein ABSG57_01490 [Candidatus Bathyarchaeia archaeon]